MLSIIIIVIVLGVLSIGIYLKNNQFHNNRESNIETQSKLFRSIKNVDEKIKEIEKVIESHMKDVPEEDVKLIENILEEWAEIQKSHHLDDRSWVRNSDKFFK